MCRKNRRCKRQNRSSLYESKIICNFLISSFTEKESVMEFLAKHKKIIALAAVVILAAAGFYFWYRDHHKETGPLVLYGNVDIRQVSVAFNGSERIEEMTKREGDRVKKGEVLARLTTRPIELGIARAKAGIAGQEAIVAKLHNGSRPEEVIQAESQVNAIAAEEENARTYYERMSALLEEGAVSRQSADTAKAQWKSAEAKLRNAEAALSLAETGPREEDIRAAEAKLSALKAELKDYEYRLSESTLTAPQDGVIRSRLAEPGDMASPQRPVYLMGLESPKWIRVYVPESRLGYISEGMKANIYTDSDKNTPLTGQVGYISDTAEFTPKSVQTEELRTSLVYEVRIYVDDEDNRLRMGMPVTVKF